MENLFSRIRNRCYYGLLNHEPPRSGHTYRCVLTGESVTIESVGKKILLRREDAHRSRKHSIGRGTFQSALDKGFLVHDDSCGCPYVLSS